MHARVEATEQDEDDRMKANHVKDKDVATPHGNHVDVRKAGQNANRPMLWRTHGDHPEPEGHADGSHRYSFIIKLTTHRAHEMRGDYGHDAGCHKTGVDAARDLVGHQPCEEGRQRSEPGWHHAANVIDAHRGDGHGVLDDRQEHEAGVAKILHPRPDSHQEGGRCDNCRGQRLHAFPNCYGRHLHAREDGGANRSANRVPGLIIIPVQEFVQSVFSKILGGAVVEPRVELVDQVAKLSDGMQTDVISCVQEVKKQKALNSNKSRDEQQPQGKRYRRRKEGHCTSHSSHIQTILGS
mmetsp:Transcript_42760/g.77246  ORF Transcript_42760/g.77246 Transcript_42760/m.77246 type:complete len:296 (-) Transcript_42760:131-1018(-)